MLDVMDRLLPVNTFPFPIIVAPLYGVEFPLVKPVFGVLLLPLLLNNFDSFLRNELRPS